MYGIHSGEEISEELLNSYAAWNRYLAHLWYNFFYYCGLRADATVLEIAPGTSNKIALALKKADFSGKVYLVEPYGKALEKITALYREELPKAEIFPLQLSLKESLKKLPLKPDFLVSHHPLDDMLLAAYLETELFSWVHEDKLEVRQEFAEAWSKVAGQPKLLKSLVQEVIQDWKEALAWLQPSYALLSQYPSLVLERESASLKALNLLSQQMLKNIKKAVQDRLEPRRHVQTLLNANKNYNFPLIAGEVLNAHSWLLYRHG